MQKIFKYDASDYCYHVLSSWMEGRIGIIALLLLCFSIRLPGQSCPPNIDFEGGTFDGWRCYTGNVSNQQGTHVFTLNESGGPVAGRHEIISAASAELDPYGGFSTMSPNGSNYAMKLGNGFGGGEGEAVSYEFTIPANRNIYSLVYYYAVVFEDPQHEIFEQPRMEIEINNVSDNTKIECASFAFIPFGTGLPGFFESSNPLGNAPVWCKDWSPVTINLDGNAGKTIKLTFRTGDCTFRRHFGYAYIDVDTDCSGEFVGASFCPKDPEITINAPFGFQGYTWFNSDMTRNLGTGRTLTLSPAPPSGSSVNVKLTPFPGFGCEQTLTARLIDNLVAKAFAGNDTLSCNLAPVRLGGLPQPGIEYTWSPADGLSNPLISNPVAIPEKTTAYILTASSPGRGCFSTDTVKVIASNLGNSLKVLGKDQYCIENGDSAILQVEDALSIQWFKNDVLITGVNSNAFRVLETGSYKAFLRDQYGCSAATPDININISSIPKAGFEITGGDQCLIGNRFVFTNNSTNDLGAMQYHWDFGGTGSNVTPSPVYSFPNPGQFEVKLVVRSNAVCADSMSVPVKIFPNPVPLFEGEAICIGLTFIPRNLTNENVGSPIFYTWDFGNGLVSNLREPPPQIFTQPGQFEITLKAFTEQCPLPVQTFTRMLRVERPLPGTQYPGRFTYSEIPITLEARSIGVSVEWDPSVQLNDPEIYKPEFKGKNDQDYEITLTTEGGCITVDRLRVQIIDKADIQVPTAFTPNADGLNDNLRPVLMGVSQLNYFRIFNRWGALIFESMSENPGWDGRYKGLEQPAQAYIWMAEGVAPDGTLIQKKGSTILIR